jgi:aminoglycoside 6'-N-acetyltransferase I
MKIISLLPNNEPLVQHAAQLLVDAFFEHWPDAWPTFEEEL